MTQLELERDQIANENAQLDRRCHELALQKNMVRRSSLVLSLTDRFAFVQMFITLTEKQDRAKYYEQIKEGKYTKVHQTPHALDTARENQTNRLQNLETILHGLSERCPRFRREFGQIQDMLRKRLPDPLIHPTSNP